MIKTIFDCDHRNFVKNRLFALPVHFFVKSIITLSKKKWEIIQREEETGFFVVPKMEKLFKEGNKYKTGNYSRKYSTFATIFFSICRIESIQNWNIDNCTSNRWCSEISWYEVD